MTIQTTTHLNFRGDARQALEFYRSVFGGHAVINTYADFGMPREAPGADNIVFPKPPVAALGQRFCSC
jgi:PhnB protein